jgi:hypothetical protein
MSDAELVSRVKEFEAVIILSERLFEKKHTAAPMLCALFAMWCAFRIRLRLGHEQIENSEYLLEELPEELLRSVTVLPSPDSMKRAAEDLLISETLNHPSAIAEALGKMGVLALCPSPIHQFTRMRRLADCTSSHTRVSVLVELALFAADLEDYDRASEFAAEARSYCPTEWELYSICMVEGLVAFNKGMYIEAARLMARSVGSCQCDEYASLACGVRSLNLSLPEKLLSVGLHDEVTNYLLNCRDIWQSVRPQIDVWISLLSNGERPDFGASKAIRLMGTPSFRLMMQWDRIVFLEENSTRTADPLQIRKSRAEVLAGRERLRREHKRAKGTSADDGMGTTGR